MSTDWPIVRLGDHIESSLGKMLDKKKNKGIEKPYLGNSNVRWGYFDLSDLSEMKFQDSESDRYEIKTGDLIICEGGEPGRCAIWKGDVPDMKIQKALHRVRPKPTIDNYYLYYWFLYSGSRGTLEPYFTGTTIKHLTGKALKDLEIQLPPLEYQEHVAKVMKSLDDKIELNRQTNQTLEQIAQALFKSWFVDFEPVKAKIAAKQAGGTAQQIERAAMAAISGKTETELDQLNKDQLQQLKTTATLFPEELVDSELGEIPLGWEITTIKALASTISKGTTPRKTDIEQATDLETIPFLKVRDISNHGEINRLALDKIPFSVHSSVLKRSMLETNDLLFSIAGTIGRVSIIEKDLSNSNCNQAIAFIRLKKPHKLLELCRLNLIGNRVQEEVASKVVQGVQANFSLAELGGMQILIPSDNILTSFNKNIGNIATQQRLLLSENRRLSELRDILLPKLLNGEIQITKKHITEVVA